LGNDCQRAKIGTSLSTHEAFAAHRHWQRREGRGDGDIDLASVYGAQTVSLTGAVADETAGVPAGALTEFLCQPTANAVKIGAAPIALQP
jgi:hypothetical protein